MSSRRHRVRDKIHLICNVSALFVEIIGIGVVSYGNYLEGLYCQDVYAKWISLGALILVAGGFIQKKLPWSYTRFGAKDKE